MSRQGLRPLAPVRLPAPGAFSCPTCEQRPDPGHRPHNARSRPHSPMSQQSHQPSLLNHIAQVLLCLVFIHTVIGKLTGFAGVAGAIAAKGLPLEPLLLVAAMDLMAVASVLVFSGWRAQLGFIPLLLCMAPTTLLFHAMSGTQGSHTPRQISMGSPAVSAR